jgi:hypothetical protein
MTSLCKLEKSHPTQIDILPRSPGLAKRAYLCTNEKEAQLPTANALRVLGLEIGAWLDFK